MIAASIEDVIAALDDIVTEASRTGNRLGYFPALYRKVTIRVKEGIEEGIFADGERMELLDVAFANRYLAAYDLYEKGERPRSSWEVAFRATGRWWPIVLQHLLAAMNAHINLDLGVAAARTAPGSELADLEGDFLKINSLLAALVAGVKEELATVWPALRLIDRLTGPAEDTIVNFSMSVARDEAWLFAESLASVTPAEQLERIARADELVARLGRAILDPPPIPRLVTRLVRLGELGSVPRVIDLLS